MIIRYFDESASTVNENLNVNIFNQPNNGDHSPDLML